MTKEGNFTFPVKIKDFSILDATSTDTTGGKPIPAEQATQLMAKSWTVSGYFQDTNVSNGTPLQTSILMYSF